MAGKNKTTSDISKTVKTRPAKPRAQAAKTSVKPVDDGDAGCPVQDRYIVPALRRGLAVLRLFSKDRTVITVPEIVRELGVSRATAFRLAYTLETDGYLQRAPHSNAFQLGLNVLSLGFEYLASLSLVDIARPILQDLRDRMDASTHMGVRDGTDVIYLLSASSTHRLRSNIAIGSKMPAHATSVGRALLFDFSQVELRKLYQGVKLPRYSEQTPSSVDALYKRVEIERKLGFVSYRSAFAPGIASVAAPIRDQSGRIVAAINVSDYESLPIMREQDGRLKDEVLRAAATISHDLGYRG